MLTICVNGAYLLFDVIVFCASTKYYSGNVGVVLINMVTTISWREMVSWDLKYIVETLNLW